MQEQTQTAQEKAREIIIQNTQKGQLYRVEFAHDPRVYEGMPIVEHDRSSQDADMFEMLVVGANKPAEVVRRSVHDVIRIEAVQ